MDRNTMIVLIVLIIAVVIVVIFSWLWMYTPYMGGYHGNYGNHIGSGMMQGY
jgi:regulator of protease activity HflC (stomatin/prohibitin superfamily)